MLRIKETICNELIIKKSKFLSFLHFVNSENDVKRILNEYKEKYSDATHICYAYILNEDTYKYYDDGEPSSSAGFPIYYALKNNNLVYTLCVVIRYFGGVKLGVGGLTHAYSSSCIELIKKASIITYVKSSNYIIECTYSDFDKLDNYINKKGIALLSKQFLDSIFVELSLSEDEYKELTSLFPLLKITLSH